MIFLKFCNETSLSQAPGGQTQILKEEGDHLEHSVN